jgi:hypothetical protein
MISDGGPKGNLEKKNTIELNYKFIIHNQV